MINLYQSVNHNGYYSRKWNNSSSNLKSLRLKHIYPLTDFNEFVIDNNYLYPIVTTKTKTETETESDKDEMIETENARNKKLNDMMYLCDRIGFEFNHDNRACLKYNLDVIGNANLLINQYDFIQEQKERIERHNKYEHNLRRHRSRNGHHDDDDDEDDDDSEDGDYKASTSKRHKGMGSRHNGGGNGSFGKNKGDDKYLGNVRLNYNDHDKRYGHLLQFRLQKYCLMMENKERQYQLMVNPKMGRKYKFNKNEFVHGVNGGQKNKRHSVKIADDLMWEELKWSHKGVSIRGVLYQINKVWLVKNYKK